ncbi:MAG: DUF1156 domain-containing protein, partial [Candidatus Eremiobacterota bacterium]
MEKRLIEDSLPLKEISEASVQETNIRRGHIKNLHTWWARRPLAACRAAVYASLVPAPKNEKERKEQHELIKKLVNWDTLDMSHPDHWVIEEVQKRLLKANGGVPPKILDPFAGGGSIPLEAQRLGCETYASDLNPVAHIIQLCTLYYPQKFAHLRLKNKDEFGQEYDGGSQLVHDVRKWGEWVYEKVKEEIGHLYDTGDPNEIPVAYIWARTVTCPNPACKAEVPLVKSWWLINTKNKKFALKPIPDLLKKEINFEIVEDSSINFEAANKGTILDAKGVCLCCNQAITNKYIQEEGNKIGLGNKLMAIVSQMKGIKERVYRIPNEIDLDIIQKLKPNTSKIQKSELHWVPDEPTPIKTTGGGGSCHRYGYKTFGTLFNPRQVLALTVFCKYIRQTYEEILKECHNEEYVKAITTYLSCILSNLSRKLNNIAVWNGTIQNAFGRQAIAMMWEYPEGNPLSESAGSWKTYMDSILNGIENICFYNYAKVISKESATRLSSSNDYYDLLISDPPYYDSVPYSDLSDFFYVWLKRCLNDLYPDIFVTQLTPKRSEIIQDTFNKKTKEFFELKMKE